MKNLRVSGVSVFFGIFFVSSAAFTAEQNTVKTSASSSIIMLAEADTMADGEVRRINKGARKLTIKHGEIKSMEMPPMTMEFVVTDDAMLERLNKGDKIKFKVEDQDGKMVITEIVPRP